MTRQSVEAIVAELEQAGVRYLIAGGLAVVAHGHVRFTADIDLLLDPTPTNLVSAVEVLRTLGYVPRVPVPIEAFLDAGQRASWSRDKGMMVLSLGSVQHPATEVDLFLESPIEFVSAYERSLVLEVAPGIAARFISLADLRAMKRAAGRSVDQLDLEALARLHPEAP